MAHRAVAERDDTELEKLDRAIRTLLERRQARPLEAWLGRELDADGVPRRLAVPDWFECLARITAARQAFAGEWPDAIDARLEGFVRSLLRFSRTDGQPVFGAPGAPTIDAAGLLREWASHLSDPGLSTVVDWWFPRARARSRRHAPPPLPAWSLPKQPLAVLRADWLKPGGFVAVDHRRPTAEGNVECFALGRTWIGPTWSSGESESVTAPPRLRRWVTNSSVDLAEWSFAYHDRRIRRTALVLRGRQIAILADQVEGGSESAVMRMSVPDDVTVAPIPESRGKALTTNRAGGSVKVFPIGLPRLPYATDRGSFSIDDSHQLVLRQSLEGRRSWLPLLFSWNPERNRKKAEWRVLTVTEQSRICPPGTAYAARISWGPGETLVIYRSLGRPGLRAFLGHQTRAQFVVGLFSKEGDVEPILTVEDS